MNANKLPVEVAGAESEFERIEVVRSDRRKKTISAEIVGRALVVSVPSRLSRAEEKEWVDRMAARLAQRRRRERLNEGNALQRRAAELADLYVNGVRPREINWVETQKSRWASCAPHSGSIHMSLALADYPTWVRDYVIVHELAHFIVPDHSARFWEIVNRYPLTERARGFLIAKGIDDVD